MALSKRLATLTIFGLAIVLGLGGLSGRALAQEDALDFIEGDATESEAVEAEAIDAADEDEAVDEQQEQSAQDTKPKRRLSLMDEVVVTAQRRDEDVRDVPISMSVLSGDDLRDAGVSQFNDVAQMVPNVSINTDWFTVYMRGVGTSEVNVMAEQAVAYMFDNVYLARVEFLRAGFLDIQRMEVLKGPQGVLFGRNSPAGVINITQGQPQYEWGARGEFAMGQREKREYELMLTGPIWDEKLSFRVAGSYREENGHTDNLFNPEDRIGDKETTHIRAKLQLDATDNLTFVLSGVYFDYYIGQWASTEASYVQPEWDAIFKLQDPNFEANLDRRGSRRDLASADGDGYIVSLEGKLELWDHQFDAVTSYSNYSDISGGDLDGTAFPLIEFGFNNDYWQFTQEFRVTSPPGDIEYVGGLFWFKSYSDAYGRGLLLRDLDTTLLSDILIPDALRDITDSILGVLGGGVNLFDGDLIYCECKLNTKSAAMFGQVTWHVTEDISLMLGGRGTWEQKRFEAHLHAEPGSIIWGPLLLGNPLNPGYDTYPKTTYRDFSPKVSATWEPIEELTFYATYAQGFRSGSFNVASFKEEDVEFDPESSTTYEAGVKTSFFDGMARVNIGLFWTDYEDYQVTTFETITFESSNAEEVRVRGVEADMTVSPFEWLYLLGSLGYNNGEYVKYTDASCPTLGATELGTGTCTLPQGPVNAPPSTSTDLSGRQLFRAPRWTGSLNAILAFPLNFMDSMLLVSGSASYRDGVFIDPDLDPRDRQEAYWLFNARAGIRQIDSLWSLEVSLKNITNETVKMTGFDMPIAIGNHIAQTNPPRTLTVRLRSEF